MNRITRGALIATLLSTAAACTQLTTPMGNEDWDSAAAEQIDLQLSQAAERASEANSTLAQTERTKIAPQESALDGDDISALPPELQRPTTVSWTGPAADLVGELARNIGYDYAVVGNAPSIDIMVSVNAVDEPAIKVFEDIGYQIAQFADVFVDPNGKRLEFRYMSDMVAGTKATAPQMKAPSLKGAPKVKRAPNVRRKDSLGK